MRTKMFKRFEKRTKESFLGKPVPTRYIKKFGKKFNKKDILPFSLLRAKQMGIQIDLLSGKGGELNEEQERRT